MKKHKNIDIVVVNWNSGSKTIKAISNYLYSKSHNIICNVIVVDNCSQDNSIELLKKEQVFIIMNSKNEGFGKACNQAFEKCQGDYILLLNPDTESSISVLEELVAFMEVEPEYGIIGPQQKNEFNEIQKTCGRFPTFVTSVFELSGLSKVLPSLFRPTPIMTDWNHNESRDVDHVMGSYLLIRRNILKMVGGIDDDYFVYLEDLDLSKRVINAGYKIHYTTTCNIIHEGGGSGEKKEGKRLIYSLNSRRIYWKKHFNSPSYFVLIFFSITLELPLRIINNLITKKRLKTLEIIKVYATSLKKITK